MKNLVNVSMLAALLLLACCKKNKINPVPGVQHNTVTINGTAYTTDTIGTQIWTTQNYSGPATDKFSYSQADSLTHGAYYSAASVGSINLPAGWRVPSALDFNRLLGNYSSTLDQNGNVICNLTITEGLISKSNWTDIPGSNTTGFSAYPAGYINVSRFLRKNFSVGPGTVAAYLTSTPDGYFDSESGTTPPSLMILKISGTPLTYNFYTYYAGIETIQYNPGDLTGIIGYASLRFVKDK